MTRQKSEDCIKPQGRRKPVVTRGVESLGGGEAVPVNEQPRQLGLRFETAEEYAKAEADGARVTHRRVSRAHAEPKSSRREEEVLAATMESVTGRLRIAFAAVASNRGAPGPDGKSIEEVRAHLEELLPKLSESLLAGEYEPGNIRRVWIPKAGGKGQRGLGIPDIIDRTIQEAVREVLEPLYEPKFHPNSHGFRPGRSCHTAIKQATEYLEEGYDWVVDLDLENFFNQVHHQRLMSKLAERVKDKRLLVLIGKMLKAKVVMPNGVVVNNEEGVPQGGPLSPLLSNVVLDELDWELARRGHRFVRYADDENIYVRSERAGQRVMASITEFIERRLRLKVNTSKSAVARPEERHFLGFSLRREPRDGTVAVSLSKRSKERIRVKIRKLTPRNWGNTLKACITHINAYATGWVGFFGTCTAQVESTLRDLDAHIRRRLRAIQLKQWKRRRTVAQKLIQHGIRPKSAWRSVYDGRKSIWAMSHMSTVDRALPNSYWDERGLVSLLHRYRTHPARIVAPVQLTLALGQERS
jgi:group II intron reverse transcriptase/maturase